MGLLGPKLSVVLERQGPFRWGDTVVGTIVIQSDSTMSVDNVDIILRCTESAALVLVNNVGVGASMKRKFTDYNRLYSFRRTLFPEHLSVAAVEPPISWSSEKLKPRNKWTKKFATSYKLQAGTHRLHFAIKIPFGFPSSLSVDNSNYLRWTLTAKVFKGSVLTTSQDCTTILEVYRNTSLYFDPQAVDQLATTEKIKMYFDGYKESTRSFSGFLSNLGHRENEYKRKEEVKVILEIPKIGLVQDPHPISLRVRIESEFLDSVALTSVKVKLIRRVVATVYPSWGFTASHSESHYISATIYKRSKIFKPVKEELAQINNELSRTRITGHQTDSYATQHLRVSYDLMLEIGLASIESPSSSKKISMQCLIKIQSCMADLSRDKAREVAVEETLPVYSP